MTFMNDVFKIIAADHRDSYVARHLKSRENYVIDNLNYKNDHVYKPGEYILVNGSQVIGSKTIQASMVSLVKVKNK